MLRRVLCWLDPIALFTVVPAVCTAWRVASSSVALHLPLAVRVASSSVALHLPLADLPGVSTIYGGLGRGRGRGRGVRRRDVRTPSRPGAGTEWIAMLAPRFNIVTADLR